METRIYNDVALHGALVMSKNESGFPENPQVGTIIVKDYCLYAYIRIGGMETWYPFANKTNSYVHVQGEAALTWTVDHNLGTDDVWIQVKDESGNIVRVGKTTIDENSFTLNFTQATKGTVVVVAPDTIHVPGVKATSINVANDSVIIDNSGVRVNGSYVLTSANIETQINNAVAVETSARIAADSTLQSAIDAEVARATGVEGLLTNLTTTAKTNLVSAINEVKGLIPATGVRYIGPIKLKEGEYIEEKVRRITENGEPIEDGAPIIYTERKDGVNPAYDIRTDRWEIAQDAMEQVGNNKSKIIAMKIAKKDNTGENTGKDQPAKAGTGSAGTE